MKIKTDINAEFDAKSNEAISVFKHIILPVFLSLLLFWLFVKCFCFFKDSSSCSALVCSFSWKDGLFLASSYFIIKVISSLFSFDTILKKVLITLSLYCLALALMAFIIWLLNLEPINSFFAYLQP